MSTNAQIQANRRNAKRSTGPRTPAGKQAAALNALVHGLRSEAVLIPGEDPAEWEAFKASFHEDLHPVGTLETLLVDRIASTAWRLKRAVGIESGLLVWSVHEDEAKYADAQAAYLVKTTGGIPAVDDMFPVRHEIVDEKRYQEWKQRAAVAWKQAGSPETAAWRAYRHVSEHFPALGRYESALERALFRALHELQRLQAARSGERPALPAALDVDVSGMDAGERPDPER